MLPLVMHLLAAVVRADVCRCAVAAAAVVVAVLYLSPRQTATTAIAAV